MYCLIQEINVSKENKNGYSKELISAYMEMSFNGRDCSHYYYYYSAEKFKRPIKKAYRIIIRHSYRENGKVKKKQYAICTLGYYEIADDFWGLSESDYDKMEKIANSFNVPREKIFDMVDEKMKPLIDKLQSEFMKTEEYLTHQKHEKITTVYTAKKVNFANEYDVNSDEYDKCYDVFGELKNPEYLEKIKNEYQKKKKQEDDFSKFFKNNYGSGSSKSSSSSGYYNSIFSTHAEDDKETLKQFYRVLSKKYHPDANPDIDTSKEMKLLNQLKSEWGV
jgi:hypothetical protein